MDDCAGGYAAHAFVAKFYDHITPYRNRQDVDFFVEAARQSGGPVLEVGCGTGRVLIPIARAGIDIIGLDLSASMLDVCRDHLLAEPEEVRLRTLLVQADMREFDLDRTFHLATVPFRPFQHLTTTEDQQACLRTIHRHLVEGGRLILDIFNPALESLAEAQPGREGQPEPEFNTPEGLRVIRWRRVVGHDRFNQLLQFESIYDVVHPDGRQERLVHPFAMRYLFRFEAEHLLARCGFTVEQLYAGYDKSPYGSKYPGELIFLARKVKQAR